MMLFEFFWGFPLWVEFDGFHDPSLVVFEGEGLEALFESIEIHFYAICCMFPKNNL
jgi:hypothetical protein